MKKVTYLGWQEKLDGSKYLLVNEIDTHSAVVYDKKKTHFNREGEQNEKI